MAVRSGLIAHDTSDGFRRLGDETAQAQTGSMVKFEATKRGDRSAKNTVKNRRIAVEGKAKERAEKVAENLASFGSQMFSTDGLKKVAAWYIDTSEKVAKQAIDMQALLEQIRGTVSHRLTELGSVLDVEELPQVESDPLALEQIFANLIDNALKYRRIDEPLRIKVRGRIHSNKARYDVEDNGRGIDAGDHQRVFELFRRSGKQDRPGEGIGLAHVRALVRRLGGTMELKSTLGQGSTFTVSLPVRWSVQSWNVI